MTFNLFKKHGSTWTNHNVIATSVFYAGSACLANSVSIELVSVRLSVCPIYLLTIIIVKKLNSLKHLVRTTVAESHN